MTTTFKMKHSFSLLIFAAVTLLIILGSCKKNDPVTDSGQHASSYNAEALDKWMTIQLRLMRNATGIPNQAFSRHYAYAGITALESLSPGIPGYTIWRSKWNGLKGLPEQGNPKDYYLPANINAAMAAINRALFPNAAATDKAAIDSLENALMQEFVLTQGQSKVDVSAQFGKAVAAAVYNWAETDGYKNANSAYTLPVGNSLWKPTAPSFAAPSTPYWGNNRTVIFGSTANTQPPIPITYSTDPASPFYLMVKDVYDASQTLNEDQKTMALFWRDVPGVSSPGHWLSILQQVTRMRKITLYEAALGYALTGAAVNDALIGVFQAKYQYNVVRPITYIREVMGNSSWSSYLATPPHPEYISAHSSLSAAAAQMLQELYGSSGTFTDHTYDYMGFAPRSYSSFTAIATEAGMSRFYAGIHYLPSINAGLEQGKKVANNIFSNK
jgi:hypothetical protein